MKCVIGESGELTEEFASQNGINGIKVQNPISDPAVCRIGVAAGMTSSTYTGPAKVDFETIDDAGKVVPDGSGTAERIGTAADGRECIRVALKNGKARDVCSAPSR